MSAEKGNQYAVGNPGGGRKSEYKEEFAKLAYNYCLLGATDVDLATYFEVTEQTVNNWKMAHKEFNLALKNGKEIADAEIASKLYHRASGYSHPEDKIFIHDGEPVIVPTTKHYPPDATSAIFWLKNRQPAKWRDTQNIEVSGANGGPLLTQNIVALEDSDLKQLLEIMERNQIQGEIVDIESSE